METTLSSSNFFPPYDYHQNAQISFILRRYIAAFKNCVTGGGGVLPTMHYTGGLRPKGVPFSGFRYSLASVSYLKDSAFTAVKRDAAFVRYVKGRSFASRGYHSRQKSYIKAGKGLDHVTDPPRIKLC